MSRRGPPPPLPYRPEITFPPEGIEAIGDPIETNEPGVFLPGEKFRIYAPARRLPIWAIILIIILILGVIATIVTSLVLWA